MTTVSRLFSSTAGPIRGLRTLELPGLWLPTGHVVACDPLVYFNPQPFTRNCPPGRYSVFLHLLPDEGLIAYAELRISSATAVHWEQAVNAGQNLDTLEADEIFGYPVDAGLGCFMDQTTVALLDQHDADLQAQLGDQYISYFDNYVDDELFTGPTATGHDYCLLQPYAHRENNAAVFQAGYGDGFYATYVGLDAAGQPVKFVTEFIEAAAAG
ncbi:DUF4241 domain-containing protein [Hymenobacter negativus]|uniref:DUF4241 domain-containing protein n=1 Tax=Hymenobacter negativus TaxID=2795026 RepID=A0ABS3Q908_9BACT|nr:DUF4241 domain-containing protein [Hymenobacter negativus]MBO2007611.1 DUF4241 domain-containing protein [Hymenobacter negativus]